jgi:hypothetical protein
VAQESRIPKSGVQLGCNKSSCGLLIVGRQGWRSAPWNYNQLTVPGEFKFCKPQDMSQFYSTPLYVIHFKGGLNSGEEQLYPTGTP